VPFLRMFPAASVKMFVMLHIELVKVVFQTVSQSHVKFVELAPFLQRHCWFLIETQLEPEDAAAGVMVVLLSMVEAEKMLEEVSLSLRLGTPHLDWTR